MATAECALESVQEKISMYEVGRRVIFKVPLDGSHHSMKKGNKIPGTIIAAFSGPTQPPTYRIELDIVWGEEVQEHSRGKKIIVGNVPHDYLEKIKNDPYAII